MNPDDRNRLRHMSEAADAATRFAKGRGRSDLDNDLMLLFALVQPIQIMGEAASKVTPETRAALPDLPWASMIGIRNRLVHAYFEINRDILWTTATEALPPVAEKLRALLKEE
jgi:uncharacterized protein with HEPN domain